MSIQDSILEPETCTDRNGVPPVEVASAAAIRSELGCLDNGERLSTHVFIVASMGRGHHSIDFGTHSIRPGRVLHLQPGQVQRWDPRGGFEATVVSALPSLCPDGLFNTADPRPEVELGPASAVVAALAADLERMADCDDADGRIVSASALLLIRHVARAAGAMAPPSAQAELLQVFQAELESRYTVTRSVSDYARMLGTSTKTLSRVTAGLLGASPKELIDRRVILEARRLLAHSTESASSIGNALGFSEPTNFTKFFARHTGVSPQEFRAEP